MKRIIIPTDFSEAAWHATDYALNLAKNIGAEVLLVHAYHEPKAGASNIISIVDLMRKDAEIEMNQIVQKIKKNDQFNGMTIHNLCEHGDLLEVLTNHVDSHGNHMIVMGTQGATGIREAVFGTNATDAIKKMNAPVMVVPPHVKYTFATGVSCGIADDVLIEADDFHWLKSIIDLTKNKSIELVNVLEGEDEADDSLATIPAQFNSLTYSFKEIVNDNVIEGLENYVDASNTDCLVIIKRNLNFFEKLFSRRTSAGLAAITKCPLLVIRSAQ